MAEVFYWILSFVLILTLFCLLGYQLILLVDLEFDYINPYDSTFRINQVILPEFFIQAIFCFLNLFGGHWFIFLISLPCLYYNASLYVKTQHYADVTEIYNKLNFEKKKPWYGPSRTKSINLSAYPRSLLLGDSIFLQANPSYKPIEFMDNYRGASANHLW
ncbi:unnamed protein product [Vicia faba]|uniref:Uncharacterized protein n=1 Tax=Vicia faba TaxID=3906 RepID=A0AAV1ARD4_VICFA|nr:unnamed protein product [Vicia faba]